MKRIAMPAAPPSDPSDAHEPISSTRVSRARRGFGRWRRKLSLPLWMGVGGAAMALFFGVFLLDYFFAPTRPVQSPLKLLFSFDVETAQNALGNLAQVVVAVLGIVITVVSIVVQLAATRYTPRITPMFFRDRKNLVMLGFFVVTCILALWVSLSVSRLLVPRIAITVTLIMVTLSLLLIIPYFAYVFNFLDPEKIIHRIRDQTLMASVNELGNIDSRQRAVVDGMEQLSDVAINAITSRDQLIASSAVDALKDLGVGYLPLKVAQSPPWFRLTQTARTSPEFVSMSPESLNELSASGTWVEWKVFRQLLNIYSVALTDLTDLSHLIAIDTRYMGEAALEVGDRDALRLCTKFFNTYLRIALNTQNSRTAYNVLHQYRQLAEKILIYDQGDTLLEIAEHLRYYAHTALSLHQGVVTETIAYDLATLCELAMQKNSATHDALLEFLLSIDQAPETEAQELTLRGVRKAQIKLATAYLDMGHQMAAHKIYLDMQDERPERLGSIRQELMHVQTKAFWEIVDRGTNFDYLEPSRKEQLQVFFSWFAQLDNLPASSDLTLALSSEVSILRNKK